MACFDTVYRKYLEKTKKNWIFDIKKPKKLVKIKTYANLKDINPYHELYHLNSLFEKYDCEMCRFNLFILTEVQSIKDCYDSKLLFESNRK